MVTKRYKLSYRTKHQLPADAKVRYIGWDRAGNLYALIKLDPNAPTIERTFLVHYGQSPTLPGIYQHIGSARNDSGQLLNVFEQLPALGVR